MGSIQQAELHHLVYGAPHGSANLAVGGAAAGSIALVPGVTAIHAATATPPPRFGTNGQLCRLNDAALRAGPGPWAIPWSPPFYIAQWD